MDAAAVLAYALTLRGAWPDNPFHEHRQLAKVGLRIFCFPGTLDGRDTVSLKNTAEAVAEVKLRFGDHAGVAPYLNKRLWVRIVLDGVPDEDVRELIDDSYELVVAALPKSQRP